jgi:hypothetical protein
VSIFRQFSENTEISHLERLSKGDFEAHKEWAPANKWRFLVHPVGKFLDWHPTTGKCIVVVLSGKLEIGVTDGNHNVFVAGDMRILSDHGKGHTGRVIGDEPVEMLLIDIPED